MGYYTNYELEVDVEIGATVPQCEHKNPNDATFCMTCGKQIRNIRVDDLVWEYIEDAPEMEDVRHAVGSWGEGGESCKWYNHKDDMQALSEKFTGVLFILRGEGEEAEDLWTEYWQDGSFQREGAQITYGAFDPDKLVPHKRK